MWWEVEVCALLQGRMQQPPDCPGSECPKQPEWHKNSQIEDDLPPRRPAASGQVRHPSAMAPHTSPYVEQQRPFKGHTNGKRTRRAERGSRRRRSSNRIALAAVAKVDDRSQNHQDNDQMSQVRERSALNRADWSGSGHCVLMILP